MFTVNTLNNKPGKNRQGILALALATGRDQKAGNWEAYWRDGQIVLRYFWTDLIVVNEHGEAHPVAELPLECYSVSTQIGLSVATGTTAAERRAAHQEMKEATIG